MKPQALTFTIPLTEHTFRCLTPELLREIRIENYTRIEEISAHLLENPGLVTFSPDLHSILSHEREERLRIDALAERIETVLIEARDEE